MVREIHQIALLQYNCLSLLEGDGYELVVEPSFEAVRDELAGIQKRILTPNLDPRRNDFTSENAYCLTMRMGVDLAAVVGVRHDVVGCESVLEFWRSSYSRLYPTEHAGGAVTPQGADLLRSIHGGLCYIGDLHIAPEHRGSTQRLMCFVHYAHCLSYLKWRPDWIYSFQRREDVLRGYTDRYGFNGRHAGALFWNDPPQYRSSAEYLATLNRAEFLRLASYYARFPERLVQD